MTTEATITKQKQKKKKKKNPERWNIYSATSNTTFLLGGIPPMECYSYSKLGPCCLIPTSGVQIESDIYSVGWYHGVEGEDWVVTGERVSKAKRGDSTIAVKRLQSLAKNADHLGKNAVLIPTQ